VCVRWYAAYPLSRRNLEEMMPNAVSSSTTTPCIAGRWRSCRCWHWQRCSLAQAPGGSSCAARVVYCPEKLAVAAGLASAAALGVSNTTNGFAKRSTGSVGSRALAFLCCACRPSSLGFDGLEQTLQRFLVALVVAGELERALRIGCIAQTLPELLRGLELSTASSASICALCDAAISVLCTSDPARRAQPAKLAAHGGAVLKPVDSNPIARWWCRSHS
jgi:hypothetical protein